MGKKYLMSSAQKRLFTIDQVQLPNITYNVPTVMRTDDKININKLNNALKIMCKRHEILRTRFDIINNKFIQIVEDTNDFELEYEQGNESDLELKIKKFIVPFNLKKGGLIRAKVFECNEGRSYFILDIHHIIIDGASVEIFLNEWPNLAIS